MGGVFEISVVICACFDWFSIRNVARSLARMSKDDLNNVGSWSIKLSISLPVFAKVLAFSAAALRSRSGSIKVRHYGGVDISAHERT